MTRLDGLGDGIFVTDSATSGVDEPCTLLEVLKKFGVDESTGTFVEGAVNGDDIALRDELLEVLNAASFDGLGGSWH